MAALAVLASAVVGVAAEAAAPAETGWWNKAQQIPGFSVPPPPGVSGDELYVSVDSTGPAAVAALRLPVAAGSSAQVVLTTAPDSLQPASAGPIVACPATNPWKPARNGLFSARAMADCSTDRAPGMASADGKTIAFDLSAGFSASGKIDVVLLPEGSTPFSVTFAPPGPTSVTVTPPVDPASSGTVVAPESPAVSDFDGGSSLPVAEAPAGDVAAPTPSALSEPLPAPAAPSGDIAAPAAPATGVGSPVRAAVSGGILPDDGRTDRIVAFSLLVALLGGWWWVGSGAMRPPRLLGPLGGASGAAPERAERVAGVGRFSRPREAAPRRL